jgi:uncharacterized protein YbjT (DUF2867 family)
LIAIISGTTGLVGSVLLPKLLNDSSITQVISITRKSIGLTHPKLKEIHIADFSTLKDKTKDLLGDLYFCCLGTTIKVAGSKENFRKVDFEAIVEFGKIAKINNAQSLTVISANMADAKSSVFYNKVKGETENALIDLDLLHLNLFRPGLLVGNRSQKRAAEEFAINVFKFLAPILPETIEKKMSTDVEVLAEKMLALAKTSNEKIKIISSENI